MDRHRAEARALKRARPASGSRDRRRGARAAETVDKELEAGARAHYEEPAYYTKTYRSRTDDVAFYVRLADRYARRKSRLRAVLEYGAGNGRIALPVARAGHPVTALDLSRPMLDDFEARLAAEPEAIQRRVVLRHADMRHARLARRFDLVTCPFNTFLHLYTRPDVERFLARVRDHLTPSGVFAFDVSIPNHHELIRDPNRAYFCPRFRYPKTGEMVRYTERFDYDAARQILFVTAEFLPEARPKDSWVTPLSHRQFFPQELEALLHYNGFAVEQAWGDYQGGKLDRYSEIMALVVRLRKKAAGRA